MRRTLAVLTPVLFRGKRMTLGGNLPRLDVLVAYWWRLPSRGIPLMMPSAKVAATVAHTAVDNTAAE